MLCTGRCYMLAYYAQEICSALGFIAGLRNGRVREYLAHTLETAEANGAVHTQNGRAIFTAAL